MSKYYSTIIIFFILIIISLMSCSNINNPEKKTDSPGFSHENGIYGHSINLKITANNNSKIYYTLDGTTPTENSPKYIYPIQLTNNGQERTIKAIAVKNEFLPSDVAIANYRIVPSGTEDTINWNKKFDNFQPAAITTDNQNNVYVAGNGWNLVPGSNDTKMDWSIKKFDKEGNEDQLKWNKIFGYNNSNDYVKAIALDSQNNVYIAGIGENLKFNFSYSDWWIIKLDENGNKLWEKVIDGNKKDDYINAISIDLNDNIYVVGSGDFLKDDLSYADWWIIKFNKDGNILWEKVFDGNHGCDYANSVAIDSNNNVFVTGIGENLTTSHSCSDWWIKKFDKHGNEDTDKWNKKINSPGNNSDFANDIVIDTKNNIYIIGGGTNIHNEESGGDRWVKKFDKNGIELNSENIIDYNGALEDDFSIAGILDKKDNLYMLSTGYKIINDEYTHDWWIEKSNHLACLDKIYMKEKTTNISNNRSSSAGNIALDQYNNIYIIGNYSDKIDIDKWETKWWIKKFYN